LRGRGRDHRNAADEQQSDNQCLDLVQGSSKWIGCQGRSNNSIFYIFV
jgi:hypothetical protein